MENEAILRFSYTVDSKTCFDAVYFKNCEGNLVRRIIQTVLFCAIAAAVFYYYIGSKAQIMLLLSLLCLALAACVWYLPYSNAKMLSKAYSEKQDFILSAYDDKIVITGSETTAELLFEEAMKATETKKLFLLEQPDALFPVSKENIGEENSRKLTELLEQKLCERFKGISQDK